MAAVGRGFGPAQPCIQKVMGKRSAISAAIVLATLGFAASSARAQISLVENFDGRRMFVNTEPPAKQKLGNSKAPPAIYLPAEQTFLGRKHEAMSLDRDGAEALVKEAAERHRMDPALIRAVIETESKWNAGAVSRKGAVGLMQLIPSTAQRYGVKDLFNPKQNVDAGVRYLKALLERYNGNLDLALAAYNAGEGAVDRARGVPAFRETRNYVQRVQGFYFAPGSGRLDGVFFSSRSIRKETDPAGRTIFTND
jgi:soluble lytic murein transglycosylase-like protein